MFLIRRLVLAAALCLFASAAVAAVKTRVVEYQEGDTPLQGYVAWNDSYTGKRPGVIVVHEWWGENENTRKQARRLAEAGYVAFALDMYGKGKVTTHPATAQEFMQEALKNPDAMAKRFDLADDLLKKDPHVDPTKIGAIGYCFGGGVVLDRLRAGADLKAAAVFHGSLATEHPAQPGAIKGHVLVLVGGADPMEPPDLVAKLKKELDDAGAKYEVITYLGAKHGFTNPDAGKAGMPALAYNATADRESWAAMLKSFKLYLK
jgi:dienelactone hydrolase